MLNNRKLLALILVVMMVVSTIKYSFAVNAKAGNYTTYLPLIQNGQSGFDSKFVGLYLPYYLNKENVQLYMPKADEAAGIKHSVLAWFIDIGENVEYNLPTQLEASWNSGYISFVNIGAGHSAIDIAQGKYDSQIIKLAKAYAGWVKMGDGRRAFLAPLQEMNGDWTAYGPSYTGHQPDHFIQAYKHILDIFASVGVTRSDVWWVFAPNGWSEAGYEFEKYYPGDDIVDAVGFSSYNYGFCIVADPWYAWATYKEVFVPYIERMKAMAPGKPIIIAQTGTVAEDSKPGEVNRDKKNEWIIQTYSYLSSEPSILGILYFDFNKPDECDYRLTQITPVYEGYAQALKGSSFKYLSLDELLKLGVGRP